MQVDAFDFALPPERIAQHPVTPRESARLLHVAGDGLDDLRVADLPGLLSPGDLLVLNDTAVLPTRFFATRGAARVEVTLIRPAGSDSWWALARPGKRLRPGDRVLLGADFAATVQEKAEDGGILLRFDSGGAALIAAIKRCGAMPLPPYIKRPAGAEPADHRDYQPVFARHDGSVAAPTASLHLTEALLARLEELGVPVVFVTLHVGAGTFFPVKVADTADHRMHAEWYEVPDATARTLNRHRAAGGRVVAVGSTALRTVETMTGGAEGLRAGIGETEIFITPGYRFQLVDRLFTNFHLPRSTLFMLVAAFAGLSRMQAAYAHAIRTGYRFFSYGDASLIERVDTP